MAKATRKYTDTGYTDALALKVFNLRDTLRELHTELAKGGSILDDHYIVADVQTTASALGTVADTIDNMNNSYYDEIGRMVGNVDQQMPTGL